MIIDKLLLLGICLFLPISLYFNYSTYVKTLELKENSIILEFALIVSLLLMLKYDSFARIYSLLIYILPLIIALLIKKKRLFCFLLLILLTLNPIAYNSKFNIFELIQTIIMFIVYLYLMIYFLKIGNNLIDLSKIQKELEREKLLRSSISKLTHELKNPIAVCNGYLEMLNLDNKVKAKEYLRIITNEITRSKTIIDEFSTYGKLKDISPEELDLAFLLEETVDLLKPLFKQHNGSISLKTKEETYIRGDYNKLKQVLINLLKNTIEAEKETEPLQVNLQLKETTRQVVITITDNGVGMDKETLAKVSDVFFTTKQNGTGIGLAFSKEVVELHKGTLKIKSKLNQGTEIKITLPKEKKSEDFNNKNY